MPQADVGKQFRKELAREKAHIYGRVPRPGPTPSSPEPPAQADWAQFSPWRSADGEAQKPRRVNTVTIFCLAKKIMAQEWRRARGVQRPDPRVVALEKQAAEYQARKIERQQEARRQAIRMNKEQQRLRECLASFVDQMLDARKRGRIASLADVAELLAGAFGWVGDVLDVEWREDRGCDIWLEPWPERRERRARGGVRPALHRLRLDARLGISAYESVTDNAIWEEKRKALLLKPLRLTEDEIKRLRTPAQARDVLAEKASQGGRVTHIAADEAAWKIRVEPWDEVRRRRLSKSSGPQPAAYEIRVSNDLQALSCERVAD